ncbi:MAG TPA: enoyl-CoA hydratase/isomerase family protein [Candidatus Binataceae bacterium]|nr:enoyl-CoA hydratase/isomerase family protein [Candidatus Binataceae bacterium]
MPAKRAKPPKRTAPRDARPGSSRASAIGTAPGRVQIARADRCVIATLDRPDAANRLDRTMGQTLMELAEAVEDDETVHALALRGAGTVFCRGMDDDVDPRVVETLAALSKPTVAILNGDAFDEGLELALALDLRVGLAGARFALTQLTRGILPHFGGTQRLPRLIGATHALPMLLTGDPIDAETAMRLGLVTYFANDRAELERLTADLLTTLAARGMLGVRMVKDAVLKGSDMTLEQGIRLEEDLYALLQTTADRAEGVRAFLEKRKPLFKGA